MAFFTMGIFLFPTQFSYFFALNFKLFSIANENSHVQIECMVVSKGFMALQIFVQKKNNVRNANILILRTFDIKSNTTAFKILYFYLAQSKRCQS